MDEPGYSLDRWDVLTFGAGAVLGGWWALPQESHPERVVLCGLLVGLIAVKARRVRRRAAAPLLTRAMMVGLVLLGAGIAMTLLGTLAGALITGGAWAERVSQVGYLLIPIGVVSVLISSAIAGAPIRR